MKAVRGTLAGTARRPRHQWPTPRSGPAAADRTAGSGFDSNEPIFIVGLIAAVMAGETGKSLLVHESCGPDGRLIRRVIDNRTLKEVRLDVDPDGVEDTRVHVSGTEITRIDQDRDGDGRIDVAAYYDANKQLVKAGFSLAGDGVVDAWAYRDANGQIVKIEVSRRRDNTVDR